MIYDISPLISPKINVWPGDQSFERLVSLDTNSNDNITLSSIKSTLHLGAHTDAPNHYAINEMGISDQDLTPYIGKCQVMHVQINPSERIKPDHLKQKIKAERLLLKTGTFPDPENWNNDFAACSAELINYLAELGVCLIGIDTPSIDLLDDKKLESHTRVHFHRMAILEGIVLDSIKDGIYELIALPLKIKNADASPVRAILRDYK